MDLFFKNLFGKPAENFNAPPPQTGRVFVDGSLLCVRDMLYHFNPNIKIDELQYIYRVAHWGNEELLFFDGTQHFLPLFLDGLTTALAEVAQQLGVDAAIFSKKLTVPSGSKTVKTEIWRRVLPDNYRLLPLEDANAANVRDEFVRGFWVLAEPPVFVQWDTIFDQLAAEPFAFAVANHYGSGELRFSSRVRLGSLEMDDFRLHRPISRTDVPLYHFYAHLQAGGTGKQNYFGLKTMLEKLFGHSAHFWERADQNSMTWSANGLEISVTYSFDSEYGYESGSSFFMLKNERDYPIFLENGDYEDKIEVNHCLFLPKSFALGTGFRQSVFVKHTPRRVLNLLDDKGRQFAIWRDDANQKIGFANSERAMIFPTEVIGSLEIYNTRPAKGPGSGRLSAFVGEKYPLRILEGECNELDEHLEAIRQVTSKTVDFQEDYDY